ncbi:hypothetical protein [Streptomyces sp. NPDC000994]
MRQGKHRSLAKTSLQHQLTGAAVNLIRSTAWLTDEPHARTRTSPLTALSPAA